MTVGSPWHTDQMQAAAHRNPATLMSGREAGKRWIPCDATELVQRACYMQGHQDD